MKILRWLLGGVVGLWALFTLFPLYGEAAFKAGWLKPVPPEMERLVPYMNVLAWWHLAVWLVSVVAFLLAAWRLFRGGRALIPYVAGVAFWGVHFAVNMSMPTYRQVFSPQEVQSDYVILAVYLLIAGLIWLTERGKRAA